MISRRSLVAALPAALAGPRAWAQGPAPLIGRFAVVRNRPFTAVRIGGRGPFRFLLDTGASTAIIRPALAAELGLPRLDPAEARAATRQRTVEMFAGEDLFIGESLRQRGRVSFVGADVGEFDGVLPGAAMFAGRPVEIDFASGEFRIFAAPPDRTGFERLPLLPSAGSVGRWVVETDIDGAKARLIVDTGGAGAVLLSGEFVGFNRLWDRYRRWAPSQGMGLFGTFETRLVRPSAMRLGAARFERPLVNLVDPFSPAGDAGDGAIGMDVLRRFTLSVEPGQALWVKPNAAFAEPFRYNRAGLGVRWRDGAAEVAQVLDGSPAARAGVAAGDRLPRVETPRQLAQLDWLLTEEPGARIAFDVARGEASRRVELVLEELL